MHRVNNESTRVVYRLITRFIDLTLGSILLIFSLPVILLAAIAVRMESSGNPFFVQSRIGLRRKPFRIFKLRGMYVDAKDRYPELYDYSRHRDLDFYFHHKNDPRVTRVGAFLRRTSIDELPNFLNVVLGDMTLVGPRPEVPDVEQLYGNYSEKYFSVKPGVTCLSKITGRDSLTKQQTIKFDLDYVDQMSLLFDMKILWRTFKSVLLRKNVLDGRTAKPALEPVRHVVVRSQKPILLPREVAEAEETASFSLRS